MPPEVRQRLQEEAKRREAEEEGGEGQQQKESAEDVADETPKEESKLPDLKVTSEGE